MNKKNIYSYSYSQIIKCIMTLKFYLNLLLFIFLIHPVFAQNPQTIIHQYIEATGGLTKWKSVRNFYDSSYTWSLKDIFASEPQLENYERLRVRVADSLDRYKQTWYVAGEIMGQINSDANHTEFITYINGREFFREKRDVLRGSSFEGLFEGFKLLRASKISFKGKKIENGREYYVLQVTNKDKEISLWYFNAETHLLEKSHLDEPIPRFTSHYLDYQEIDGLLIPMVKETRNSKGDLVMRFEKIKVQFNLDLPDDFFTLE